MTRIARQSSQSERTEQPDHTEVADIRHRVFLPQPLRERIACSLWSLTRMILFRLTPISAARWRAWLLRRFGADVHPTAMIHPSVLIDFPWNLVAGEYVIIEHRAIINCMGRVIIGDNTRISQYAHLCAGTHNYRDRRMPIVRRSIHIGRNVWIAADSFVGPGVRIGDGSLLAARSSAFGNLPAGQICVGEPAKPRKKRFEDNHDGTPEATPVANH